MAERDPIDLIRVQLSRAGEMAGLHPDHEAFRQWHLETRTILEKAFGSQSGHCQNFQALRFKETSIKAFASPEIDKINTARYKKDLESVKNILQGAIKELTLDRTLFKKIQTTPKTVEISIKGEYFVSSGITEPDMIQAIQRAFDGSGLTPLYGSEPIQKRESLDQRIDQIRRSRFGIYNLSVPEREEVLLEIGIALGMGRQIVLICPKGSPLPDTMKRVKHIEYEHFPDLTQKLKQEMG